MAQYEQFSILIQPDQVEVLQVRRSDLDDLDFFHRYIKGFIEIVRLHDDVVMIVDDEGKMNGLPLNKAATCLYNCDDIIVGPALVMKRRGPDLVPMTADEAARELFSIQCVFYSDDDE